MSRKQSQAAPGRMRLEGERAIWALLVAVVVEVLLAVVLRGPAAVRVLRGDSGWRDVLEALALLWLVAVLIAVRAALRAIRSLRSRIADLTVSSHDWYWESDGDLVLTYSSAAVTQLLGYRPEEVVGRSLYDFVPAARLAEARAIVAQARVTGVGWRDEHMPWRHASGFPVALVGNAVPLLDSRGQVIGFRGCRQPAATSPGEADRLADVRGRLGELLADRALRVALQPITGLIPRRVVGFEALARFDDGRSPDDWFADAAQVGLRTELELLALTEALPLLERQLGPGLYLSVNASPQLIRDPRFAAALAGLQLSRVVVEITEHAVVARYDELTSVLAPLRQRGLRLAVDDAGAGYASFAHVLQLRPDIIKIDRSVVSRTPYDAAARALVVAITRLAIEMDATVVAEGIETHRELATLAVLDVTWGQGYYLGRPSTLPEQWHEWHREDTTLSA
jgi:PAS domain S-box-containing protein